MHPSSCPPPLTLNPDSMSHCGFSRTLHLGLKNLSPGLPGNSGLTDTKAWTLRAGAPQALPAARVLGPHWRLCCLLPPCSAPPTHPSYAPACPHLSLTPLTPLSTGQPPPQPGSAPCSTSCFCLHHYSACPPCSYLRHRPSPRGVCGISANAAGAGCVSQPWVLWVDVGLGTGKIRRQLGEVLVGAAACWGLLREGGSTGQTSPWSAFWVGFLPGSGWEGPFPSYTPPPFTGTCRSFVATATLLAHEGESKSL